MSLTEADLAQLKGVKLGRILAKLGKTTRERVHEALAIQKTRKVRIGQLLVELGYCQQKDIDAGLAAQAGLAYMDLSPSFEIPNEARTALTVQSVQAYQCVPVAFNPASKKVKIAIKSPDNFRAKDDLRQLMGLNVEAVVADPAAIDALIKKFFSKGEVVKDVIKDLASDDKFNKLSTGKAGASIDLDAAVDAAEDNRVIKLLNMVLMQAINDRASDIHFEPFEDEFKMRYRIDGVLYEMEAPPKQLGPAITSRVKVMGKLDIAERRLPQDGRIELQIGGAPVDLRISVLPTMHGESVVMRVLDRSNVQLSIDRIGMRDDDLELFKRLINKPNGIVVVTGPTGSGKTTTLYAALAALNDIETKILTAEDPVEYDIDGLCQVQVNHDADLTFARALRSFLRQDPDIILVGEIRDLETAEIAVQASLTGHLVLTTLHTNDAPSSVIRLVDLGLEPFLLTATMEGVVAQRLVRCICPKCKESYTPKEEELMELALTPDDVRGRSFYRGAGCDNCYRSGYRGRSALFEIMAFTDEIRDQIMKKASTNILKGLARRNGMRSLRECGLLSIYDGQTTIDEVVRETLAEED
ncbi:MAG: GspE/PulE family protein [Planctomycetaceae bacterium]|jgi:type IV pilus assembly protein PilB|nr:GspE/PulE family protein [Planctomycetaceae bacterium]